MGTRTRRKIDRDSRKRSGPSEYQLKVIARQKGLRPPICIPDLPESQADIWREAGVIIMVVKGKYGFIKTKNNPKLFFYSSEFPSLSLSENDIGREVSFEVSANSKGPVAIKIEFV
ncbi:hypothetical protein COB52_01440 [Candidatus Kaiserbacteria bacterium]|nr:MAG: hypothetical protein COB52_01440 [Candidatus Kaiserbacteria bacterium]